MVVGRLNNKANKFFVYNYESEVWNESQLS